ncbi:MAG: efflux RND transporter permease subunit [Clostridia bacterium]|nr:efflux RND transporter permease subunit [Clostridia bacterium]
MSISETSVKRPVAMSMVVMIIVVIGLYALTMLPIDLYPNITMPMIAVQTNYSGVSPSEIEEMVTKPIESAVARVSGIDTINSTSSQGSSMVIAQFDYSADMDVCAMETREKVDLIKGMLPADADDPIIIKMDPSMIPIASFSVSMEGADLEKTKTFADGEVVSALEGLSGVGSVTVSGGLEREIQVNIDPAKLLGYNLSLSSVTQAIGGDNKNLPGGDVDSGGKTMSVRTIGEFTGMEDIETLPLILPNGQTIYMRDLADVQDTYKEKTSASRLQGAECISVSIQKQSGANTVQVMQKVNAALEKLRAENPQVNIKMILDQGEIVENTIKTVAQNAIFGGLLAVVILFIFLQNIKTTLVLAASIPTSIIATFAAMYFMGITLNIVSLGGLALGVGMLVDNAIVVLENIFKWRSNGKSAKEAAIYGAKRVTGAVIASTLTTVVVFLPVAFTEGMTSIIFREMSLTVAFSQLCSLLITLMLVPMLASKLLRGETASSPRIQKMFTPFNRGLEKVYGGYEWLLRWALSHRKRLALITVLLFIGSICLVPMIGAEFMPTVDSGQFTIDVEMPKGTALAETDRTVKRVEEIAQAHSGVDDVFSTVSGDSGSINVTLKKGMKTKKPMEELRKEVSEQVAGANITMTGSGSMMGGSSGGPINVKIKGEDYDVAAGIADQILLEMQSIDGIRDAKSSVSDTKPEVRLYLNRQNAAQYGMTNAAAASAIRAALDGQVAGQYTEDGTEYDIRVKFPDEATQTLDDLKNIKLTTPKGGVITISEIADIEQTGGPLSLTRENQKKIVTVSASLYGRSLSDAMQNIQKSINTLKLPDGYTVTTGGDYEQMTEAFGGLFLALLLSILLVYMVMAAQFESLLQPFIIMFSIPLSFIGVFLTLFLSRNTLNVTGLIGVIMLVGIVVNNAIVLLDYINQNKKDWEGSRIDLIVEAGKNRLRPILMTTLTSVLGYLPSILSFSQGSEMMKPLAWVLMGGLSVSTLLTLVFIPTFYSYVEDRTERRAKKKEAKRAAVGGGTQELEF